MELIEVTEKDQYNQFVAAQMSGSFLQSWEWGQWQKSLGREVLRYFIKDGNQNIAASLQLIKMPLPFGKFYLYAPYGPVSIKNFNLEELVKNLKKIINQAVFIRIEPINFFTVSNNELVKKTTNIQPAVTMVLDVNKTEDELLAGMHHKTRYNIRLAVRHNVLVEDEFAITPGLGLYSKEALSLILDTQKRQKYRGHSESYYKNLIDFFALHNSENNLKLHIYKAVYQKQLLAAGIFIDFGKTRVYLYGGSSDAHREVMAPYVMHWQAILDAKKTGLEFYDFGGSEVASGGERGFTRFKQGFGGRVVNYSGAWDVIGNKALYKVYLALRSVNKTIKKISPV